MKSVNEVFLLGHVGMIEPRSLDDGTVVADFSVATNTRWKDKDGVAQESVEWHRCEAWNKLGELVGQSIKKGSAIHLEGRLKIKKWSDDAGAEVPSSNGWVLGHPGQSRRERAARSDAPGR